MDDIYIIGIEYRIGMSDGKVFEHMEYVGLKFTSQSNYAKPNLLFLSLNNRTLSVNPSYVTYIEEELIQSEGEIKHGTTTSIRQSTTPTTNDNINAPGQPQAGQIKERGQQPHPPT
tara:strand:- start:22 stop:369 length:348 start_codon:yes stop_codon:yes gene_type:complete